MPDKFLIKIRETGVNLEVLEAPVGLGPVACLALSELQPWKYKQVVTEFEKEKGLNSNIHDISWQCIFFKSSFILKVLTGEPYS